MPCRSQSTRRSNLRPIASIAVLCATLSLFGCAEESVEHTHREIPQHRPVHFKAAVADIKLRSWELANKGGRVGSLEFVHFVDVIGWIPEMAADSDLAKAEWESARAASDRMKSLVLAKDLDITELESVVEEDLATLQALVAEAGDPGPNLMDHHHHHDHHHGPGGHTH